MRIFFKSLLKVKQNFFEMEFFFEWCIRLIERDLLTVVGLLRLINYDLSLDNIVLQKKELTSF
jgi:hypothetical protein